MEKRRERRPGLTALFWRYLITTGGVLLLLIILWWMGLTMLLRQGFVRPASTAADQVSGVVQKLESGEITPAEIPYYYRWALFDAGQVVDEGNMNGRFLDYAKAAIAGDSAPQGMLYSQYHRIARLPGGLTCVVQYDYSMPYGSPELQNRLPEFQTCATVVLALACLLAGAVSTRHFAGLLRRDAALLTAATHAIAQQRLDAPLTGRARVRELGETLAAMEQLREHLARSLERQWAMEQQRRLELAALTHDLKTPLTLISGNAELLQEDNLPPAQREMVETILRSTTRLQDYVAQLRALTAPEGGSEPVKEPVPLAALAEGWQEIGRSLCAPKKISFVCSELPDCTPMVCRADLDRAVSNLLDNAVRYTPAGGKVRLGISAEEKQLHIFVEDTGPGFSAEALAKGPQAFFTSDASRPKEGHLGLGLFYADQTARKHGGELRLSNTGQGARAELSIAF